MNAGNVRMHLPGSPVHNEERGIHSSAATRTNGMLYTTTMTPIVQEARRSPLEGKIRLYMQSMEDLVRTMQIE